MIWIDVEDLFTYARLFRRPSGIQRAVFELCQALSADHAAQIGLLRHAGRDGFTPVAWSDVAALFTAFSTSPSAVAAPSGALALQCAALRALCAVPGSLLPHRIGRGPSAPFAQGDVLLVAGAGWDDFGHAHRLISAKRRFGLRLGVLVYDLIPLRRQEWCDRQSAQRFRLWIDALLTEADLLLAISQATSRDVAAHRATLGLPHLPATVIRLGDGFSPPLDDVPTGIDRPYALFVSTLEIRKNHAVLIEAWRELLKRHGPDQVPALVLVGRQGALTGDMLSLLRQSAFLDGMVVWRQDCGDAELAALYRGCRFTLFPSLYEGWGLPVAESLCFGKPCLAANASSVPEIGGSLVDYFDPLDLHDALRVIETAIFDPAGLAEREAMIRAAFRPTPWTGTAAQLLAGLAVQSTA
jgi:glycosyltransferase involved in cell wall biosynthesis